MKIHIIDDNEDLTTMLMIYFTKKGHNCSFSNNGKGSLDILKNQNFDFVLLDLAMPDFSGFDVVEHLYESGQIKNMKIIAFTASSPSVENESELISKGIISVLKKPMDPDILLDYLTRLDKKITKRE